MLLTAIWNKKMHRQNVLFIPFPNKTKTIKFLDTTNNKFMLFANGLLMQKSNCRYIVTFYKT